MLVRRKPFSFRRLILIEGDVTSMLYKRPLEQLDLAIADTKKNTTERFIIQFKGELQSPNEQILGGIRGVRGSSSSPRAALRLQAYSGIFPGRKNLLSIVGLLSLPFFSTEIYTICGYKYRYIGCEGLRSE